MATITRVSTEDIRFDLAPGAGTDAVHREIQYAYAVTRLETDAGIVGCGLSFTLGDGTDLVCSAAERLAAGLVGRDTDELLAGFGAVQRGMAEHHQLRWLGPHKGVVHLALASITNACFDLWAKLDGVPLWKFLLDRSPEELVALLDLSYLEEVLTPAEAIAILTEHHATRAQREGILRRGYPGYDTSVGWFEYSDTAIRDNAREAVDEGFTAIKLKVGSEDSARDVRRVSLVRETVGDDVRIMLDANQAWSFPTALRVSRELQPSRPFWIEEPTQPDDVLAHKRLAEALAPTSIAVGEAVSNRVLWKNFLEASAVGIVQADCTRLAGVSEYLAVVLLAHRYPVRVVPHVGDMGQIHQHLVLFQHVALAHEEFFLESIPHLRKHFAHPARVEDARYVPPQEPGASTDIEAQG